VLGKKIVYAHIVALCLGVKRGYLGGGREVKIGRLAPLGNEENV